VGEKMKLSGKLSILLSSTIVLVLFNNCAKGSADSVEESAALNGALNQYGGSSTQSRYVSGTSGNSSSSSATSPNASSSSQIVLYVSNSPNGPWVENGRACSGQLTYYKLSGANLSRPIKGCMDLSSNKGCHDLTKHRSYLSSEIINGDIVTTLSASDTSSFPKAEYSFFISESPDNNTIVLRKVGVSALQNCGSGTAPPPNNANCRWTVLNPRFVIGPSPVAYPPNLTCTTSIVGREEFGFHRENGTETQSDYRYRCDCN
jgi:hypothetical protein